MPGVTPKGMDYHHSYGGMNGHGGYGYGPRNGYGGPDMDQHSMDRFDNTRDMAPSIELDHLATYSSKSGVMKPEDGLRKLRGMESTTGIWTMRCLMIIERKYIIVIDKGNGEELERFPLDQVYEPTAIFKEDRKEVYTNLILFTILDNPGKYNSRCDMHIFQSINVPAQNIVDEILAAKDGRPGLINQSIPPPPMGPAPDPPGGRSGYYGQSVNRASYEPSSGQNETLERDVQFLNCCFDDIEKFVARLQQAAEAYKELENRRRERQSHKKKNDRGPPPKDGMLSMRAKPPPADDFIDIFQKIKWAFNLLAKLKAHIHDPNAPELVHFIFTPLSLIYEASRDPVHNGIDLASKAVSPLITREAKELLLNCLTSKELELWQLLGRNWTTSEDETQSDRYKPPIDKSHLEQSLANHRHQIEENNRVEEARYQSRQLPERVLPSTPRDDGFSRDYDRSGYGPSYGQTRNEDFSFTRREDEPTYSTRIGASKIGTSFKPDFDDEPYRPQPMYERKRPTTPPPGAVTNLYVAKNQDYVEKHNDRNEPRYPKNRAQENAEYKEELRRKNSKIYEAVHERTGRNQKEITVEKGDILEVLDDSRNWWRLRNYKGETGYAPYTILRDVGGDSHDVDRNGGRRGSYGGYSGNIGHNHIPVAPPPPRRDEEQFERVIKPSKHLSDGRSESSDNYRQVRRHISREHSPGSDGDNFSGSYDGQSNNSMEDKVERRRHDNRGNEKPSSYKPETRHRNSAELRKPAEVRGHHNRSFDEEPPVGHKNRTSPPVPSFVPPPPPENRPLSGGRKYTPPVKSDRRSEQQDELHNELSQRLTGKPIVKSKPQNTIKYISTKSTTYEVSEWLRAKSFSQRCIRELSGYNGYDLLRMKVKDLEKLIPHDEAQRLDGHLTLQKNMSGYKTQGPRELQAILQQRKEKAETHDDDDVGRPPSFAPDSPDYSDDNSDVRGITDDLDNMLSKY